MIFSAENATIQISWGKIKCRINFFLRRDSVFFIIQSIVNMLPPYSPIVNLKFYIHMFNDFRNLYHMYFNILSLVRNCFLSFSESKGSDRPEEDLLLVKFLMNTDLCLVYFLIVSFLQKIWNTAHQFLQKMDIRLEKRYLYMYTDFQIDTLNTFLWFRKFVKIRKFHCLRFQIKTGISFFEQKHRLNWACVSRLAEI